MFFWGSVSGAYIKGSTAKKRKKLAMEKAVLASSTFERGIRESGIAAVARKGRLPTT